MKTKVVLYYSDACGYCKQFEPTWNALKETFKKNNIEYAAYEAERDADAMKNKNIKGYPTIRIETDDGEFEYGGPRTPEEILYNVTALSSKGNLAEVKQEEVLTPESPAELPVELKGGAVDNYEEKYKKYKAKYLNLKAWMKKMGM